MSEKPTGKLTDSAPETRVEIRTDFDIASAGKHELKADLYVPPEQTRNGAAILLVFGGSWRLGDKSQQRVYGLSLAKAGFTCMACDYRLSSTAHWPAQNHDISEAAQWLNSQTDELGILPGRIGISGNSSGGQLALMAAAAGNDWHPAAICAFYPPTRIIPPGCPGFDDSFLQLMGPEATEADYQHASPLYQIGGQFPPTLLIVGGADSRLPPENTLAFYRAMQEKGHTVELHNFAGLDHAFDMQREMATLCAQIMASFFKRYLLAD